jgi:hypothetical protein
MFLRSSSLLRMHKGRSLDQGEDQKSSTSNGRGQPCNHTAIIIPFERRVRYEMTKLPPDDLQRTLTLSSSDNPSHPHIGLAGNTYTILLTGKDTASRYSLIDMYVLPGGGPRSGGFLHGSGRPGSHANHSTP